MECCCSPLYLLLSAFPYAHAACGMRHSAFTSFASPARACERLHLSSRLTARWFCILICVRSSTQTQNSNPNLNPCQEPRFIRSWVPEWRCSIEITSGGLNINIMIGWGIPNDYLWICGKAIKDNLCEFWLLTEHTLAKAQTTGCTFQPLRISLGGTIFCYL